MQLYTILSLLPAVALACEDSTTIATPIATPTATVVPSSTPAPPPSSGGNAVAGEIIGFGAGTTGGGAGAATTVTSCSELESALAGGGVITISGILNGCDILKVNSDTTIVGSGGNSGLENGGFRLKDVENVIIQNLVLHNPPEGKDLIDIESSTYIVVDHCDFSTNGLELGEKDFYDGLLDAKRGSDFLTFSYNKFHDHFKASLIGHSDSNGSQDEGTLHVTYHHNYWNNVNSRAPSVRFGTAHIFSSCYENINTSGVNSRMGAQVLVEETSFTDVRRAIITNLDSDEDGFATERNNVYENSDINITQEASFTPPYAYT
jgi:pectate lyase